MPVSSPDQQPTINQQSANQRGINKMMTLTRMRNELENYLDSKTWRMREDLLKEAKNLVARYSVIREYEDDVSILRDSDYQLKVALENLETAIHNIQ